LYDEVRNFLSFLNKVPSFSSERSAFLLSAFTLKLLGLLGYRPELNFCLNCREPIRAGEFHWHGVKGGAVCASCVGLDREQWFSSRPLSDEVLKLMRFAMTEKFAELLRPHLSGEILDEYHEAVEGLIVAHFPTIPATTLRAACRF
jgi:DNA repair protein RecO (recombination protein O)